VIVKEKVTLQSIDQDENDMATTTRGHDEIGVALAGAILGHQDWISGSVYFMLAEVVDYLSTNDVAGYPDEEQQMFIKAARAYVVAETRRRQEIKEVNRGY